MEKSTLHTLPAVHVPFTVHKPSIATAMCLTTLLLLAGCADTKARSDRSFDEIHRLVLGKNAEEVILVLGEPDSRQKVFDADEKWIWWNYTFLEGNDYPPEVRGQLVHLEIVFKNPARAYEEQRPYDEWSIDGAFGVSYKMPSRDG